MRDIDFINKDLKIGDFSGVVIDNNDPTYSGRCRIRVFGLFDETDTSLIPWFTPKLNNVYGNNGSGSLSIPKLGTIVQVTFYNGDITAGQYIAPNHVDRNLIEMLKSSYQDSHILLYDEGQDLKISYQTSTGIVIEHKGSSITISPDSMITVAHSNNDSIIQLENDKISIVSKSQINITSTGSVDITSDEVNVIGKNSTNLGPSDLVPALRSDQLLSLLATMCETIDGKFPASPGTMTAIYEKCKMKCTSKNVNISK